MKSAVRPGGHIHSHNLGRDYLPAHHRDTVHSRSDNSRSPTSRSAVQLIGFTGCYPNSYANRMMERLTTHPEVGGVVLVSLGCEGFDRGGIADHVKASGRPAETFVIQQTGGTRATIEAGLAAVQRLKATGAIAGYFVCNDVSESAFRIERHGTWDKGKGCDSFGPIGPWLVTADEVADPAQLDMWLDVNGVRCQTGNTRTMVFKPAFLVGYVSQFMRLQPGDVISTGTPSGVRMGMNPPRFPDPGDVIELGIEGLGTQRQVVVPAG